MRSLHAAGIQVILDVVYNHTAELDDKHPYTVGFRGVDARTYYMVDPSQYVQLLNFSGCGHTVNANNPVVKQLIIDSLVRTRDARRSTLDARVLPIAAGLLCFHPNLGLLTSNSNSNSNNEITTTTT